MPKEQSGTRAIAAPDPPCILSVSVSPCEPRRNRSRGGKVPVIPSAANDLVGDHRATEILRCARDDDWPVNGCAAPLEVPPVDDLLVVAGGQVAVNLHVDTVSNRPD
jgi:hypothetical protein